MLMDEGIDTGPILAQAHLAILPTDTAETLSVKLAELGARLLIETIPRWCQGQIVPRPQDDSAATKTARLRKEDGLLNWIRPAVELERLVRAYTPWPSAYCHWDNKLLKILEAKVVIDHPPTASPGSVVVYNGYPAVGTGNGLLVLLRVQLEGRRPVDGRDFLRGHPNIVGVQLTEKET